MMRYGINSGINLMYSPFLTIGITLMVLYFTFFLISPKRGSSEHERILDILITRYVKNEIDEDKYYEIKSILIDEDSDSSSVLILKEKYASGDLSTLEFIKMRNDIK